VSIRINRIGTAEPFVSSFCSHANDHQYERANGLLSQWRGYGGMGRFALVFDTQGLDDLLAREWRAHFWIKLELAEVVYFKGHEKMNTAFPKQLQEAVSFMSETPEKPSNPSDDFLIAFIQAATLLKHRGFQEEREVRIVAIPHSRQALADRGREDYFLGWPPNKEARTLGESKKYVALFESLDAELPIKRIIVGPGANQKEDIEFARSMVSGQAPITSSEAPFIG